jgi:hypothetical protein
MDLALHIFNSTTSSLSSGEVCCYYTHLIDDTYAYAYTIPYMLTKIPNIIQSSELRKRLAYYLRESDKKPVIISTERGGGSRVLLDSKLYNKLVEVYEDKQDAQELETLVAHDDGTRVSLKSKVARH